MTDAAAKTITGPNVQTPIVKNFVGNKPGKFFLIDLEWMLDLQAISIAPGVDLRLAPASFEPISIRDSEFACRKPDGTAECCSIFRLMPPVWRPRLTMKVKRNDVEIFVKLENKSNSPTLIRRLSYIVAKTQSHLSRDLKIIPTLVVVFRNARLRCYMSGAHKYPEYKEQ